MALPAVHPAVLVLEVRIMGTLAHAGYRHFVPAFERILKEPGRLRVLFELSHLHGWDDSHTWGGLEFDLDRFTHIERLAIVGDRRWQGRAADFCRPFTAATIRYFDRSAILWARRWLESR